MSTASTAAAVELDDIQGLVRFGVQAPHARRAFCCCASRTAPRRAPGWRGAGSTDAVSRRAATEHCAAGGPHQRGIARPGCRTRHHQRVLGGIPRRHGRATRVARAVWATWARTIRRAGDGASGERVPHVAVLLYALPGQLQPLQQTIEAQLRAGFERHGPPRRLRPGKHRALRVRRRHLAAGARLGPPAARQGCQPVLVPQPQLPRRISARLPERVRPLHAPAAACARSRRATASCRAPRTHPEAATSGATAATSSSGSCARTCPGSGRRSTVRPEARRARVSSSRAPWSGGAWTGSPSWPRRARPPRGAERSRR